MIFFKLILPRTMMNAIEIKVVFSLDNHGVFFQSRIALVPIPLLEESAKIT